MKTKPWSMSLTAANSWNTCFHEPGAVAWSRRRPTIRHLFARLCHAFPDRRTVTSNGHHKSNFWPVVQIEIAPPIRSVRKDVPRALELLIEKMIETNPAERYQDMREVMEALDGYTNGDTKSIAVIGGRQRRRIFRMLKLLAIVAVAFFLGWLLTTILGRLAPTS